MGGRVLLVLVKSFVSVASSRNNLPPPGSNVTLSAAALLVASAVQSLQEQIAIFNSDATFITSVHASHALLRLL